MHFHFSLWMLQAVHYLPFKGVFSHFSLSRAAGSSLPWDELYAHLLFLQLGFHFIGLGWKVITWKGLGYPEPPQSHHQVLKKHFNQKLRAFLFFRKCSQAPMAQALSWLVLFWSLRTFLRGEWVTFVQANVTFDLICCLVFCCCLVFLCVLFFCC